MFAFEVVFLTGRAVATDRSDRESPEWPLHPGRLYSALVAAAFECFADGGGNIEVGIQDALIWLEQQAAPSLSVSDADPRETVPVFVPVNDKTVPERKGELKPSQITEGLKVLPERRSRQQRYFPSVTPHSSSAFFVWPEAVAGMHQPALEKLAATVTYLGHSSSLVHVMLTDTLVPLTHQPDEGGVLMLRVPTPGRLKQLAEAYRRNMRPTPGMFCAYARVGAQTATEPKSVFGDALVFRRTSGQPLPLWATLKLTTTVRNALVKLAHPNVPEVISGHGTGDQPSRQPHIAIVPLPFIDHFYADGSLLGFAIVLPRTLTRFGISPDRRAILRAAIELKRIWEKSAWSWEVELLPASESREALQFERYYTGPAKCWATVTPIVCDRHPKEKEGEEAEYIVAESCLRIGLPSPVRVETGIVSPFRGVPPSGHFHGFARGDVRGGHRVHAIVEFEEAIRGPVIIGKTRHLGLGLMRPYKRRRQGGGK